MSTDRESPAPRLFGAALCASASLLLLLSSFYLYAADSGGAVVALLLIVGLGLLTAAVRAFVRRR